MCDTPSENLIDFNIEEKPSTKNEINPFNGEAALIPPPRLSLENNPFDLVQKLSAYRTDDPFDIVEIEASLKARQICSKPVEVKLGNLLSLSEDSEITASATDSNIFHTAEDHELENESPPATLCMKWSPCSSTASCESSDSNKEQACCIKTRKTRNHRNRLLKLSISNAAFSTPNSSRLDKEDGLRNELVDKLISLPSENEDSNIDSESPVKLIDEDLKFDDSNRKQSYSEKDFEHDLEMMEIPILRQLPSPDKLKKKLETPKNDGLNDKSSAAVNGLEALRERLHAKRLESSAHTNISELINGFKNMIIESKMIDEHNKHEVDGLLQTLTSALFAPKTPTDVKQEPAPQPIARQGTFDRDLRDKQELLSQQPSAVADNLIGEPVAFEEIADAMLKSSATYDGETAEDKAHLNLPQIDPPSPEYKQPLNANFQGIMDQLQHFLEQQQLSTELSDVPAANSGTTGNTANSNPTFIVVMPALPPNSIAEESYDSGCSSYRRRSQSLSLHDKLKIVQLPMKPTPEIEVSETYDTPPLNMAAHYETPLTADFKTPARFLERRNSFSSASPYTPARFSRLNQSISKERSSSAIRPTTPMQAAKIGLRNNETRQPALVQRPTLGIRPDPKKKVRTTSSVLKSNAPLKATLPFKQVAPIAKNTPQSAASVSNTSMHLLARAGHMSHTSTPMPSARINGLKPLNKVLPNFPTASTSATKPISARLSNIVTTPVGKNLSAPTVTAPNLRRRTIAEFKAKSPNKPRPTLSNLKPTLNRPLSSTAKNSLRPTIGGNSAYSAPKYKENKQPNN